MSDGNLLVSVLTPTWQRHGLLMEAIENVRAQTYRPLEHVIVSDGEDDELARLIRRSDNEHGRAAYDCRKPNGGKYVPIRFAELGRNWTGELRGSHAAAPMIVGQLMARGEYHIFWADDERATPDHIASLVELCETTGAEFAYSQTEMYLRDHPETRWIIGQKRPEYGHITNCLYRASLLDKARGPFRTHVDANDWDQIRRFMEGGARWAFLPRVTLTHRADR